MINVDNRQLQKFANLAEIEAARLEMASLPDDKRGDYIDGNASKWTALRQALWGIGYTKCWYSEASIQASEGHVEHFRPKKRLSGAQHPGYWWRAFDWTNLRLAHPTVNVRLTDYLTGKKSGKGSYFPLRDENKRAQCEADEVHEEPVLLDPANPQDCRLLCFDISSGRPIPRFSPEEDEWRHMRAAASIDYYHLDEGTWNYKRKDLMDDVSKLCDKIEEVASAQPYDRDAYERLLAELAKYLRPFAEFSAAAVQVVRERGLLEHTVPVPKSSLWTANGTKG
jgi:hypothetical protein